MPMQNKFSPIKDIPLPVPGESLLQRRTGMVFDCLWCLLVWCMLGMVVGLTWLQRMSGEAMSPVPITLLFVPWTIYAVFRAWRLLRDLRNFDLGLMGELHVGQLLEGLRADGYHPVHDIMLERMNIDHVLVGPGGVFTVETKMLRKTRGIQPTITSTRGWLVINGHDHVGNRAAWQAEVEARSLEAVLRRRGVRCPAIQPVLVFPGWFVTEDVPGKVWVVNDRYLLEKIRRLRPTLTADEVDAVRSGVEYFARETIKGAGCH